MIHADLLLPDSGKEATPTETKEHGQKLAYSTVVQPHLVADLLWVRRDDKICVCFVSCFWAPAYAVASYGIVVTLLRNAWTCHNVWLKVPLRATEKPLIRLWSLVMHLVHFVSLGLIEGRCVIHAATALKRVAADPPQEFSSSPLTPRKFTCLACLGEKRLMRRKTHDGE